MTPPAAASAAHRGRVGAPARPLTPRPRRVSGPARPPSRPRTPPAAAPREQGLANGLLAGAEGLLHARSLDRLIRGRGWIAVIAFALIGIVTLQLGLLKLNAGMGRSIERAEALQRKNAALSIENSELAAGGRVEALASRMGMVVVPSGTLRYLRAGSAGQAAGAAAAALSAPSATAGASSAPSTEASSPTGGQSGRASAESQAQQGETSTATGGTGEPQAAAPASETQATPAASTTPSTSGETAATAESAPAGGTQAGPAG